jgi:hypothetical protein
MYKLFQREYHHEPIIEVVPSKDYQIIQAMYMILKDSHYHNALTLPEFIGPTKRNRKLSVAFP